METCTSHLCDMTMDIYRSFSELSEREHEGSDFRVNIIKREGSNTLIVAPHGGAIEPGTSEVAKEVAKSDLSMALFEGIRPRGNRRLHITSTNFDESRCIGLVRESDTLVTIHGEKSDDSAVFLGGKDEELGANLKAALEERGYAVKTHENTRLHGLDDANICNRGRRGAGVQLEISYGLRSTFFASLTADGRKKPLDELIYFAAAVREGLYNAGRLRTAG